MNTDNIGGVYTYSLDLAGNLKTMGAEVVLAVTGSELSEQQKTELQEFEYYFAAYKQEWMENPWDDIAQAGEWLMEINEKVQPDLVHLNSFSFGNLPWDVPVIMVFHSCVLSWWNAVHDEPAPARWKTYEQQVRSGLQNADKIIAPSRAMLNEAERFYGPFSHSEVIYNGRNPEKFFSREKGRYIFSMGRLWDEAKNVKLIVEAAREIDCPIYIAGDNSAINTAEIPENVIFTGKLDQGQIAVFLAGASIYLLPVKYEPFGYSFVEAAFSKCALIGGKTGTLQEIWQDNMIYVENVDELVRSVNDLLQNGEKLKTSGEKAYQKAIENYTLEKMTGRYLQLYQQLLKLQPAKKPAI